MITYIHTNSAPAPAGHYSQATVFGTLVFVAGQLPIDPATGEKKLGSIKEQADQVLKNVKGILEASGSGFDKVLKSTVYISDISLWGEVNEVYAEHFGEHRPARAVVPTRELHHGFTVEMEVIASI